MLNNNHDRGHACLIFDYSGNVSFVFLLIRMLNYDLGYICLLYDGSISTFQFDTVVKNMPSASYIQPTS